MNALLLFTFLAGIPVPALQFKHFQGLSKRVPHHQSGLNPQKLAEYIEAAFRMKQLWRPPWSLQRTPPSPKRASCWRTCTPTLVASASARTESTGTCSQALAAATLWCLKSARWQCFCSGSGKAECLRVLADSACMPCCASSAVGLRFRA
eukprot:1160849-Pelagomonas_calceolata.AAC.1